VLYLLSDLWGERAGTWRDLCPIRFSPAFGDCRLSAFGLASLAEINIKDYSTSLGKKICPKNVRRLINIKNYNLLILGAAAPLPRNAESKSAATYAYS